MDIQHCSQATKMQHHLLLCSPVIQDTILVFSTMHRLVFLIQKLVHEVNSWENPFLCDVFPLYFHIFIISERINIRYNIDVIALVLNLLKGF